MIRLSAEIRIAMISSEVQWRWGVSCCDSWWARLWHHTCQERKLMNQRGGGAEVVVVVVCGVVTLWLWRFLCCNKLEENWDKKQRAAAAEWFNFFLVRLLDVGHHENKLCHPWSWYSILFGWVHVFLCHKSCLHYFFQHLRHHFEVDAVGS